MSERGLRPGSDRMETSLRGGRKALLRRQPSTAGAEMEITLDLVRTGRRLLEYRRCGVVKTTKNRDCYLPDVFLLYCGVLPPWFC